jgi:hypothetical protein
MKESITKFDLESAFKALDELEIPKTGKVRANKPALTEIFSRKTKFDALMEEYYDISNTNDLADAKDAREAEIAQAKLARIEKIVDLDADSAEDLLTSYVGKLIIQCPQCMTLFYKNQEDVVAAEEDPSTVNVNEVCQHCGNESGYSLIGKVGEADSETEKETTSEEPASEDGLDLEIDETEAVEETDSKDEELADLEDLESLELDLDEEPTPEEKEEKKEESFTAHTGEALVEELADDKELDDKLEAHSEYIEYLRTAIAQEEEKLEKTTNEQVKIAIQRNIDAFKADLENALPDAVKEGSATEKTPIEETTVEEPAEEVATEETPIEESLKETYYACAEIDGEERRFPFDTREQAREYTSKILFGEAPEFEGKKIGSVWTESLDGKVLTEALHEDTKLGISEDEFEELINSPEFKKPVSDTAVRAMLNSDDEETIKEESVDSFFDGVDELKEADLENMLSSSLIEMYGNIKGFKLEKCTCVNNKFMIEGLISFKSGNTRKTTYTFNEAFIKNNKVTLRGLNEKLGMDKHFYIAGYTENKAFITESLKVTKD